MVKSKVTPHQLDLWSSNFAYLYNAMEGEIFRQLIKRLNNGKTDILQWQSQALKDLNLFNKDCVKILAEVTGVAEDQVNKMFQDTGMGTVESVDNEVPYKVKPMPSNLDNITRAYTNQAWSDIDNLVNQTLVSTNYKHGSPTTKLYQQTLVRTQQLFNAGLLTFDQAMEKAIQEMAQKGIKSTFVDKGGHTWSMERYVRTVLKSTLGNTFNELRTERMTEYGTHLVRVSQHVGAREACSKIQGQVVDLRPMSKIPKGSKYRSIWDPYWHADYEEPSGHRGINCDHEHFVFIDGVNTNTSEPIDPELNEKVRVLKDKQRRLERKLVKFKKNKLVSESLGNIDSAEKWQKDISAVQKGIRDLVDSNEYLIRNYQREKVYTPLNTLLKDFRYDAKYDRIREKINVEKFNRHVRGTKEYDNYLNKGTKAGQAPSYLTISAKKAQAFIDAELTKEDFTKQSMTVEFSEVIGIYVNQTTGEKLETNRAKIHFSKTGIHIVPTKPR